MLTKETFISTILEGVLEANDKQCALSGGYWLFEAGVESLMQVCCAEKLHAKMNGINGNNGRTFLECKFSEILINSNADKKRGPIPKILRGKKRIDILLTRADGTPMAPIEVKRNAIDGKFVDDIDRILLLLSRTDTKEFGSIKFGAVCAFIFGYGEDAVTAENHLKERIKLSRSRVSEIKRSGIIEFHSRSKEPEDFGEYGYWAAGAVCVYLRRKRESG